MIRRWLVACLIVVAGTAAERDPSLVLQRAAIKVRVRAATLPNYTCVQTVTRDYYVPKVVQKGRTCAQVVEGWSASHDENMRFTRTDRLRLDVAMTDHGEIYSWAGASRFEDSDLGALVHRGPISSGAFGAMLAVVFGQDPHEFRFEGMAGPLMEFSFRSEKGNRRYKVRTTDSWIYTAYSGRAQIDPETDEVVRLTVKTDELPLSTGSCQTVSSMEFAPVRIGDREFPLPKAGKQQFVDINSEQVENTSTFASCREYRGQSTITFGGPAPERGPAEDKVASVFSELPSGVQFLLELTQPIAADTAAGGDAFKGRVVSAIRDKVGRVLVPAHAAIEGRLLRVENFHTDKVGSVMVLRPQTIEIGGMPVPLHAIRFIRVIKGHQVELPLSWETNAGLFRIGGAHAVLKAGFRSEWLTR